MAGIEPATSVPKTDATSALHPDFGRGSYPSPKFLGLKSAILLTSMDTDQVTRQSYHKGIGLSSERGGIEPPMVLCNSFTDGATHIADSGHSQN